MIHFDEIWHRIEANEGEEFQQIRGGRFTYLVRGSILVPNRTNQSIPRSHFEKAAELLPLKNTVPVQDLRGPSYIYAILMDDRIRGLDW